MCLYVSISLIVCDSVCASSNVCSVGVSCIVRGSVGMGVRVYYCQ